jgi:hypothetical protein
LIRYLKSRPNQKPISNRLLTDGKLEEARFILEDLAFRSPDDPNVLYNRGMIYSEFHELDIVIDI